MFVNTLKAFLETCSYGHFNSIPIKVLTKFYVNNRLYVENIHKFYHKFHISYLLEGLNIDVPFKIDLSAHRLRDIVETWA